jgi:hypothetical protein
MLTSNPSLTKPISHPKTQTKNTKKQKQKIDSKNNTTQKQHHQNQVVFYNQTEKGYKRISIYFL